MTRYFLTVSLAHGSVLRTLPFTTPTLLVRWLTLHASIVHDVVRIQEN